MGYGSNSLKNTCLALIMTEEKNSIKIGAKELPENLKRRAKEELNETDESVEDGIKTLREWIDDSGLKCSKDKDFLLRFLRVKKFNVEESFVSIISYTRHFSALQSQLDIPDVHLVKHALINKVCVLLPYRDAQGRAVIVNRAGVWTEDIVPLEDALKAFIAVCYYLLEDPATQVGGILLILDVEEFAFSETTVAVDYSRLLISLVRCYPARFQRIDVINEHMVFTAFMTAIKRFLPSKISKRISFHGKSQESLMKNYEPWMLPEKYGGTLQKFDNDHFLDEMDRVVEKLNNEIIQYRDDDDEDEGEKEES